jgi:hypothetical protein
VHNSLSRSLAKGIVKSRTVVLREVVADEWLSTVFVNPLQHLVSSSISETGEKRRELGTNGRSGIFFEDDLVDGSGGVGLSQM